MTTLKVWNGSEWEYLTGGAAILQQDAEPEDPVEDDLWVDTDAVATDYATDAELTTHAADTTSVHGITDTSALALTSAVVTKALLDAKGDLIVATAADTPARLAVGVTNGHVLTVDSAETTGLKWAEAAGGGGADIPYQTDAPSSPSTGDLWVDSDEAAASQTGLLTYKVYNPGSASLYTSSSGTFADMDATNLVVTFTAPNSGAVLVSLVAWGQVANSGAVLSWNLRSGSSDVSTTASAVLYAAGSGDLENRCVHRFVLTGLTPGTSYTYKWGFARTLGTGDVYTKAGGSEGQALMEVWVV